MLFRTLAAGSAAAIALAASTAFAQAPAPGPAWSPPAAAAGVDTVPDKMPFNTPYGAPISADRAQAAIQAAAAEAKKRDWPMNIAVTDSGGNLVAFLRMDGSQLASIVIAEHKARAAVKFRRETKAFETAILKAGAVNAITIDDVIGSRGGIPLVEGGKIIGAVGCSGATSSQDEVVCMAGAATINK